jgi:hypothetical protein
LAGIATITAIAVGTGATPSTLEFEFVADRSLLDSAREYFEIVAPVYMQYTVDTRIVGAAASGQRVRFRYRDVEVQADDLQVSVNAYELRARNARLKIGKNVDQPFANLYLKFNQRRGFGTTTYRALRYDFVAAWGGIVVAGTEKDGKIGPGEPVDRFGLVEVRSDGIRPLARPAPPGAFEFVDLSESISTVSAQKVVIFPRREAQFRQAQLYVAGNRLVKLPLFQINYLASSSSPLVTDNLVGINNNKLAINYPYFLTLQPGLTSLLRFRTGEVYGRGYQAVGGSFLDYEIDWNRGDDMQGGLAVTGLFRSDWSINARQYMRFNQDTSAYAQIDAPAGRGIFGSGSFNHQFGNYNLSLSGNASRSTQTITSESQSFNASVSSDPTRIRNSPVRVSYGVTANTQSTRSDVFDRTQSGYGVRLRAFTTPINLSRQTRLTAEATGTYLTGTTSAQGFGANGTVNLSHQLTPRIMLGGSYFYTDDGFNDALTGRHRIGLDLSSQIGSLTTTASYSRGLDIENTSLFANAEFRFSPLWGLRADYTRTDYLGFNYLDYNLMIGYRIGWREVGLVYSYRTKRIGFQFYSVNY